MPDENRLTAEQDGWVRVPVTLTDEMVSAWNDADPAPYPDGSDDTTVNRAWAQADWSAMIAAAPPAIILDSTKEAGHGDSASV